MSEIEANKSIFLNETEHPENLSPAVIGDNTNLSRLVALERNMKELTNTISLLQNKNFILEKIISNLSTKVNENELYIRGQDIYSRRNNVEFSNISEDVHDDELENYIIKMLKAIQFDISSYDIIAVHRIGRTSRKPRNVIVRFLNRKDAYKSIKYSDRLKSITQYKKIFVTENLCPVNRRIFNALYKLKKTNIITSVWSYNGNIFYRIDENDDYIKADTLDDIQYLFDDNENQDDISSHNES